MAKKKGGPKTGKKSKHRFSFKEKAAAPEKPSPFAIRSGKLKFDILGRKVKGDKGNVVKAREAGHTKRKNTLLKEYEASGKSNAFIDRRFGEDDASMTPEERAIGRLARTRLRQIKRGSGYNLNDGSDDDGPDYYDDGPITLTHGGKPIDEREEERRSAHAIARGRSLRRNDDDSDDDMNMDAATTGALHFGGGDDDDAFEPTLKRGDHDAPAEADGDTNDADDERRKTKKEVMDELIDKSKYHKAERAKQRERDEDLLDKLDDEFKEISGAGLFRAALSKGVGHLKPDGWERGKKNGAKDAAKDAKGTSSVLEKKMTASAKEALALAAVATDARGGAIKDDYDRLTRELVLESRGQATDRMRTNEEVDAAEAAALETAERARLKRMNAVDSDDDGISDDDMGPSSGGYAARRAKAKRQADRAAKKGGLDGDEPKEKKKKTREDGRDGGDDLDGNFDLSGSDEDASGDEDNGEEEASEESESDDGEMALDDKKQMTKAFKKEANKMAAELDAGKKRLRKLGILEDGGDVEDSDDDDDEDGDAEEDEADDSDDDDEGDDSDSGDEDEYLQMERMRKELEKRGVDTKQFLDGAMRGEGDDDDDDDDEDDEDEDNDEEEETEGEEDGAPTEAGEEKELSDNSDAELSDDSDSESWPSNSDTDGGPEAEPKQAKAVKPPPPPPPAPVELPFTFPMPETPEALEKIVGHLSAEDTTTALERIRKCHAPTLKEDNRKKMQGFLGLLLQRFETLAGMSPLPVDHLDVIAVNIAAVANIVPFFAVTSARARLEKMSRRLTQRLRDGETGWPPARTILLISLFADVFPVTDKQHPVSTPAALYLGNVLAHCAVRCAREAVSAAVTSSLAARYSAPAGRVFPEAITLLSGLVHASAGGGDDWAVGLPAHAREQIGGPWLAPDLNRFEVNKKKKAAGKEVLDADADAIAPVSLASMLVLETEPSVADRDAALLIAVSTLRVLSAPALATAAAKEVLAPAAAAVNRLALALSGGPGESANEPGKGKKRAPPPPPPALVGHLASVAEVCVAMDREMREALAGRLMVPLRLREKKVEAIKTYNPMFEEQGYSKGRDYDPNRERAEKRKLRREVKKEKRGAVRELRKDNRFLAETVAREREAAADERGERQRETLSFLEKMESDLKSGGQGGMIVKNQRRVNGPPKRDRKKR